MRERLLELLPELMWIQDEKLREAAIATYEHAFSEGGLRPDDLTVMPFTLSYKNCTIPYLVHVRAITRMCRLVYKEFGEMYKNEDAPTLDYDVLIAGALLHDVGKLLEYTKNQEGEFVTSVVGRQLRHPVLGTVIAMRDGIPSDIAHAIAVHSREGEGALRSPEAVLINKIDLLNLEAVKSYHGLL